MNKQEIIRASVDFTNTSPLNRIDGNIALSDDVIGLKMYEEPIFGFSSANDEPYLVLKEANVIGEHFRLPRAWLASAKTVISFFFPFTKKVRKSNALDMQLPSDEWLHARIEGQKFLNSYSRFLQTELINAGYDAIVPSLDKRFWSKISPVMDKIVNFDKINAPPFTSNWSERHVAFICGLGTFGLSRGLITPKGMAGRFGSIITSLDLVPDKRHYSEPFEYCLQCGKCGKNCPAGAISIETGKDNDMCSAFLDNMMGKYHPRYGCGKCQVKVPCEHGIPKRPQSV